MAQMFEVGTRAWQPDPNEGWVASEVEQRLVEGDKVKLVFRLESGEVSTACLFNLATASSGCWKAVVSQNADTVFRRKPSK
jgi:hypothetical protein